jgi:hypothetical protein
MKWRIECECQEGMHSVRSGRCSSRHCERNGNEEEMVNLAQDEAAERLCHAGMVRGYARDFVQVITVLARRRRPLSEAAAFDVIARAQTMEHMLTVHMVEATHA